MINKVKTWHDDITDTLIDVAIACIATNEGTDFDAIAARGYNILPRFQNPAQPTLAQMTDSNVKIASVEPLYAKTRTFWRTQGFTDEQVETIINEINQAEQAQATSNAINAIFGANNNANTNENPA